MSLIYRKRHHVIRQKLSFEIRIGLIYASLAVFWFLVIDYLATISFFDQQLLNKMHCIKDWIFVFASTLLLAIFIGRETRMRDKAQAEWTNLFENAALGIFQSDLDGYFIRLNRNMALLYGYESPEEMLLAIHNGTHQINVEPDAFERFMITIHEKGMIENWITQNRRRDGSLFWCSSSARLVQGEDGNPSRIEGFVQDITARKEAEDALIGAENRFRTLVEQTPTTVYLSSNENLGETFYISPQIERLTGYTPREWIGDSQIWVKILHPDDRVRVIDHYRKSQKKGKRFDCEYRLMIRDNRAVWVRDISMLVPGYENGRQFRQGVLIDADERKRTDKVNQVIDQIAQATISTRTLDKLYAFIHHALADILTAENFYIALYDPLKDLLTFPYFVDKFDDDTSSKPLGRGLTEYVMRTRTALLASPEVFDELVQKGEVESIGPASIDWLGVPLIIEDRVIGIIAVQSYASRTRYTVNEKNILTLVSAQIALAIERKRAMTALSESEERYRRLVEFSPEAIAVHCDGEVVFVNPAGVQLIGAASSEEVIGKPMLSFVHPDYHTHVTVRTMKALTDGVPLAPLEEKLIRLDGTPIDVEVTSMPLVYDGKNAVQVIIRDISVRKKAEALLQRQLHELTVLNQVASAGALATDTDELIASITRIISQTLYPDNCGVVMVDQKTRVWTPHPSYHGSRPETMSLYHPLSEGISGKVARTGETIRSGDIQKEPDYFEVTSGVMSEISVPIIVNEQVYGVLNAESRQKNAFEERDERLLKTIAESMVVALEKIRLLHTEQKRRREAEILREATVALSGPLDLSHRYELILDTLSKFAPYDSASIALSDLGAFVIVAGRGLPEEHNYIGKSFPLSSDRETLASSRQPLVLEDAQYDPHFESWPGSEYIRSWMAVPLVAYDRVTGFLYIDGKKPGMFTKEKAALIQTFANQAAVALENARLFEAEQKRRLENSHLLDELQVYNIELSMAYDVTLEGWGRALEMRDRETQGHTHRVTELTLRLARRLGLPESQMQNIRRGALLHDIGKIAIPDQILKKPGPLSAEEWDEMRKHPQYAYDLLYPILYLRQALDIPYCHHERWDGTGYPRGLRGEEIPLVARIFSVVDVWDAVLHDRPYLKAWSKEQATAYLAEQRGHQFDPNVVDMFLELVKGEEHNKANVLVSLSSLQYRR